MIYNQEQFKSGSHKKIKDSKIRNGKRKPTNINMKKSIQVKKKY